jgi:myo-inositol-1(or 4)-monophosphatase
VAGLTWLPFTGQRYTAVHGGPVRLDGVAQPPLGRADLADSVLGIGTFNADWGGRYPGRYRLAVFTELTRICGKMRMHGSTGIDMAFVGAGILGAAISFGHHIWDHAAGVALVRAAGGTVTDLAGEPWTVASRSALAAAPGAHEQIMEILHRVGSPERYR